MPYPIQEQQLYGLLHSVNWTLKASPYTVTNLLDYVTNIGVTRGAQRQYIGIRNDIGALQITLLNYPAPSGKLYAFNIGDTLELKSKNTTTPASPFSLFYGRISDVTVMREFNRETKTYDVFTQVTAQDPVGALQNLQVDGLTSLKCNTLPDGMYAIATLSGVTYTGIGFGLTYLNRTLFSGTAQNLTDILHQSVNAYYGADNDSWGIHQYLPSASLTDSKMTLTDGTHSSTHGTVVNYVDAEITSTTSVLANKIEVQTRTTPYGVPSPLPTDVSQLASIVEVETSYIKSNSVNVDRLETIDNFMATGGYATNIIGSTGASKNYPETWSSNSITFGSISGVQYNGHNVIRCRVGTAFSSHAFGLNSNDPQREQNLSFVGGGTGNIFFGYQVKAGTGYSYNMRARLNWYNAAGTLLSSSLGTTVAVGSTSWVRPTVTAAPPTNAVSVVCAIEVTSSASVGVTFYVTEAIATMGFTTAFFDGNSVDTSSLLYAWESGQEGSYSHMLRSSELETVVTEALTLSNLGLDLPKVTVNAQSNTQLISDIELGDAVYVAFAGVEKLARVCGIEHSLSQTSWLTTFQLAPVITT